RHHAVAAVRLRPGLAVQPGQGLPHASAVRGGPRPPARPAPRGRRRPSGDLLMIDLALASKALSAACESVRDGTEADAVAGIVPQLVASPSSTAEASALLRAAAEHDLALVPRGSGSRLGWGFPVTQCDLVVDMLGMGGVIEHAAGDLVARVQA